MRSSPPWGVPMPLSKECELWWQFHVTRAKRDIADGAAIGIRTIGLEAILAVDAELDRLGKIETAARPLALAADALLDVTVASTPNTRLSSVAKQIGALNRAWKEYQDAT